MLLLLFFAYLCVMSDHVAKFYMWYLWCALSRAMSCCVKDCNDQNWQCNKCDQAYLQQHNIPTMLCGLLPVLTFISSSICGISCSQNLAAHLCQAIFQLGDPSTDSCEPSGPFHTLHMPSHHCIWRGHAHCLSLSLPQHDDQCCHSQIPEYLFLCGRTKLITFEKCISLYFFIQSVYHTWKFEKRWEKVN